MVALYQKRRINRDQAVQDHLIPQCWKQDFCGGYKTNDVYIVENWYVCHLTDKETEETKGDRTVVWMDLANACTVQHKLIETAFEHYY